MYDDIESSKVMSYSDYEETIDDYNDMVQSYIGKLKKLSAGTKELESGFKAFGDFVQAEKVYLSNFTNQEQYKDVNDLLLLSTDEFLTYLNSYNPDAEFADLDIDSFLKGTDYLLEAKNALEDSKEKE